MSLRDLEKIAALQILSYLHKSKSAKRTDLKENVKAVSETIYSALKVPRQLGLVEESVTQSFPKTTKVYLSEKGATVARRLVEIEEVIDDDE